MNRLEQKRIEAEQKFKEQAIRTTLFSIDYYLITLFRACEADEKDEVEDLKEILKVLRADLMRLGYYGNKERYETA